MGNIMTLLDNVTGKTINVNVGSDSIQEDANIIFGGNGGTVLTYEEMNDPSNIPDGFKAGLKTYFDTLYSAGSGGSGTITGSSTAPILTGPNVGNETATITISVDNYDPSSIYTFDVSGGSFSRVAGVVTWILPQVTDSAAHKLTVTVTNPGKTVTSVYHSVNVFNINATVDSMVVYQDTTMAQFSNLYNASIVNSKLLATDDTVLSVGNNKVIAVAVMEKGDNIYVDGNVYNVDTLTTMSPITNGAYLLSTTNSVPFLTAANSSPTIGTAIGSGNWSTYYQPYTVFGTPQYGVWADTKLTNAWVGFTFLTAKVINKYLIKGFKLVGGSGVTATCAPKSWMLQGSNDGTNWATLDTVLNQPTWNDDEVRIFVCENGVAYTSYRIFITANQGNTTVSGLSNLSFVEAVGSVTLVTGTTPTLPQFITSAKLLTKYGESAVITQDTYETDFTGLTAIEAIYEQYNIVSDSTTVTSAPTGNVILGDTVIFGNTTDGERSLTVNSSNYSNNILDISSLGFTVVPTYGYRKDSVLKINIGDNVLLSDTRTDVILSTPMFVSDGSKNTSVVNAVPVLSSASAAVLLGAVYGGYTGWYAFDSGLVDTVQTCLLNVTATVPSWLGYDFTRKIIINKYGINSRVNWSGPGTWKLQASNDNVTFIDLDTQTGITWTTTATTKWFTFNNAVAYRYYRIYVTAPVNYIDITELIFVENNSTKMRIKTDYSDIITGNSARTLKFKVKLNKIGDALAKLTATIQKL